MVSAANGASSSGARALARVIRFWALVDLVVTTALAVPPLGRAGHETGAAEPPSVYTGA